MTMKDMLKVSATQDLADFLLDYGFNPVEAMKVSSEFWNRHGRMLDVV